MVIVAISLSKPGPPPCSTGWPAKSVPVTYRDTLPISPFPIKSIAGKSTLTVPCAFIGVICLEIEYSQSSASESPSTSSIPSLQTRSSNGPPNDSVSVTSTEIGNKRSSGQTFPSANLTPLGVCTINGDRIGGLESIIKVTGVLSFVSSVAPFRETPLGPGLSIHDVRLISPLFSLRVTVAFQYPSSPLKAATW